MADKDSLTGPFEAEAHAQEKAALVIEPGPEGLRLSLSGAWTIAHLTDVDGPLRAVSAARDTRADVDASGLTAFDTGGAWLIHRTRKALESAGVAVTLTGLSPAYASLLDEVVSHERPDLPPPPAEPLSIRLLRGLGQAVDAFGESSIALIGFFGQTVETLGRTFAKPARLRVIPLIHHIEIAGLRAVPIITLMNLLVGGVIAYQGATQLRKLGAEVFTVDLISIGHLRELGVLLTAIMVAGRSGSAFAAELGAMKVNEEIDAMRTLALDPLEMLVLPRILALVIALPLLVFIADIAGLVGGGLVSWWALGVTPGMFMTRLTEVTALTNFWVGIVKAPVFGYLVAMIGCHEGMEVEGSAESVGQHTTLSVVKSIFIVIVVDALFSIFFVQIKW